ncbi:MAG TPA: M15 family metallopeptidase [Vicinamibacterales bacterium]|nr:M15 family metallopeptidase [Vicinamibacterales bacterium]
MTHHRASRMLVLIALLAVSGLGPAAQTQVPTWPREPEDAAAPRPGLPPRGVAELIGEYEGPTATGGTARAHLYLLERGGSLWSIIDRGAAQPATVQPTRTQAGRVTGVTMGGVAYTRLQVGPEGESGQLRVAPIRPVATVLREAQALAPPAESGTFRPADLVELVTLDPTIKLDVRYATTNNFLGSVFYAQARAFLQRPAAEAVVRAHRALKPLGYGLLVHDGYRPWFVTKTFWDTTPAEKKWLVANPASGSKHNRGAAVDLTLYDLASGRVVEMPSTYDESTPRAYAFYPGGTARQRWHRALLRRLMEAEGFTVNPEEWWHFDHDDWRSYALGNQPFEQIK